jgi:hypothetical protein
MTARRPNKRANGSLVIEIHEDDFRQLCEHFFVSVNQMLAMISELGLWRQINNLERRSKALNEASEKCNDDWIRRATIVEESIRIRRRVDALYKKLHSISIRSNVRDES